MNNNNFEITIKITGLEATCNGCTCEDIQLTSKGNFGNEYVAVLGEALNQMFTKIPDAPPAPKRVVVKESLPSGTFDDSFVEVKQEKSTKKVSQEWDLPAVWETMIGTLPKAFDKIGIGSYLYKNEKEDSNGEIVNTKIKLSFNDTIDMRIYYADSSASFYLYEDAEKSWIDGINKVLVEELIDELPADVREFVRSFVKKVLTK
jgi:hypothetical protein